MHHYEKHFEKKTNGKKLKLIPLYHSLNKSTQNNVCMLVILICLFFLNIEWNFTVMDFSHRPWQTNSTILLQNKVHNNFTGESKVSIESQLDLCTQGFQCMKLKEDIIYKKVEQHFIWKMGKFNNESWKMFNKIYNLYNQTITHRQWKEFERNYYHYGFNYSKDKKQTFLNFSFKSMI